MGKFQGLPIDSSNCNDVLPHKSGQYCEGSVSCQVYAKLIYPNYIFGNLENKHRVSQMHWILWMLTLVRIQSLGIPFPMDSESVNRLRGKGQFFLCIEQCQPTIFQIEIFLCAYKYGSILIDHPFTLTSGHQKLFTAAINPCSSRNLKCPPTCFLLSHFVHRASESQH